jgi:hypothetical protein
MACIPDLTPCTYHRGLHANHSHLSVGWLDKDHPFTTGETSEEFANKLLYLVENTSVMHYRGWHDCDWCPSAMETGRVTFHANGSIVVSSPTTKQTYEAPVMIHHYVTVHNYLPPQEFIEAVLAESYL